MKTNKGKGKKSQSTEQKVRKEVKSGMRPDRFPTREVSKDERPRKDGEQADV